jgi:tRNA (guanine37-N1)-methyltransferase
VHHGTRKISIATTFLLSRTPRCRECFHQVNAGNAARVNRWLTDSFQNALVAPPVDTRPATYKDMQVPEILSSGNEKLINKWRFEQSVKRPEERRPDHSR